MNGKRERMPAVAVPPWYRDLPVDLTGAPTAWGLFDPLFSGHRSRLGESTPAAPANPITVF